MSGDKAWAKHAKQGLQGVKASAVLQVEGGLVALGGRVRRELARKRMPGQALHNTRYGRQQ